MAPQQPPITPYKTLPVYPSEALRVLYGANEGDSFGYADDLMLDDVYVLASDAHSVGLALAQKSGATIVASGSELGTAGAKIHLDCAAALMAEGTTVIDVLVLVELDTAGHALQTYLLPLAPLHEKVEYRLVGIDTDDAKLKLAQVSCVSFTRGTQITLGTGRQCFVENLKIGDAVLTRDDGVQHIRWIGQSTQRAVGAFAPILIKAGTLNNIRDLLVSPDHRLFVYQRSDELGAGRAELLVKARHLVNGTSVKTQEGGFVDYFQLLFDRHQIIYAEGIAAESMLVDDATAALVDEALLSELEIVSPLHRELDARDVEKALLDRPDAVELLRRASKG